MENRSSLRSPLVIALLVILALAALVFVTVIVSFAQNPVGTPTLINITLLPSLTTVPSLTPSSTSTITLTPRPTWTLRPSATASNTPTPTNTASPTLIRTLTPAVPAKYNDRYDLKPWNLSEQARSIELMHADTVLLGTDSSYRSLAYSEGEGILRFPDSLEAVQWTWDRAYNLVRVNDPLGIASYAELIQDALNSGQVRAEDLPSWFTTYENRLELRLYSLPPQPGELSRGLLELSSEDSGSAYLWMLENPAGVSIFPLINDFNFSQLHENAHLYDDLTGDGAPELVIYRLETPGSTQRTSPFIFDLSSTPPTSLPLQEQIPFDFGLEARQNLEVMLGDGGKNVLKVMDTLSPPCPTKVSQKYSWNGEFFEISSPEYEIFPEPGLEAYCEVVFDTATAGWGPEAAIDVMLPLLETWPPEVDTQGKPYPSDAFDQLRYRLGVLYALANEPGEATRYMNEIIASPSVPDSSWIGPAQDFLDSYQQPEDLYITCQQAQFCNMQDAMRSMVDMSNLEDISQVWQYLKNKGVSINSSSPFDFDEDGQDERWLIVQPKPESKLEFWILSETRDAVEAVFVKTFEADQSLPFFHEPAGEVPVIQFELHEGFIFNRLPDTLDAFIEWVDVEYARPTIILDGYIQAVNDLFSGVDPLTIRDTLLELFNNPRFKGDCIAFNICDQFHYTLALVHDLLDEEGTAIDEYLWVWRNYGESPYSTLSRLKLDYTPLPTYTKSAVTTGTATITRTPTPTSTQSLGQTPYP